MARRPGSLPADLGTVFSPEQARAAGVTARRLRARDIEHPHRGLLVAKAEESEVRDPVDEAEPFARDRVQREGMLRRARLYRPLMVKHAFFAGRTAGGIWGLPIDCSGDLEVGVPAPRRAPRRRGIRGRQLAPALVTVREVDGLPLASPASTWAMMAAELSVRELIVLGDAIVRIPRDDRGRRRPDQSLASVEQLRAAAEAGPRRAVMRLRESLDSIRIGSASPLETEYRLDAVAAGIPEPELDVEIRDVRGRLLGVTEVLYREHRVLVEVEGDHHRTSRQQWNRDIEKYAAYVAEGFEVVRLTSAHIRGESPTSARIVRDALIRHGWRP